MATHSSVLAWRIPGMGEPGGLLSMGSHRVGHDWSDLATAAVVFERIHLQCGRPGFDPWIGKMPWRRERLHSSILAWRIPGVTKNQTWLSNFHFHFQCLKHKRVRSLQFSSVQLLSRVWLFGTPWIAARQASLSITNSQSSPRLTSIESVMPSSHLILCCPLLLPPPIPPSIRVFSNKSTLRMRWPKYWNFSFSIIPSKEHPGLISFRMDWLDLLAAQGTLKSLLQHHSSKASILRHSAFFTVRRGQLIFYQLKVEKCQGNLKKKQ